VALTIAPGIDITGKVQFTGRSVVSAGSIRVQLRPKVLLPGWPSTSLSAVVSPDGAFVIPNVPESQYSVSVGPLALTSYVGELNQGRNSILDRGILIVDRRLPATLDAVITSPPATIRGTVAASPEQLAAGVTITLVPEDNRLQNFGLYKRTLAASSGSFSFDGVTPGGYKLFAWERIPDGAEQNREFMEAFSEVGTEIIAVAGTTSSAGLRLTSK
jgi:hypothetical protein